MRLLSLLHGFQANLDIPSSEGGRLAVEQANRDGGLLGRWRTVDMSSVKLD